MPVALRASELLLNHQKGLRFRKLKSRAVTLSNDFFLSFSCFQAKQMGDVLVAGVHSDGISFTALCGFNATLLFVCV